MTSRRWTIKQRKLQAERIKKLRPWEKSTGPKTDNGKKVASMNAYKGGIKHKLKELRKLILEQKKLIHLKFFKDY